MNRSCKPYPIHSKSPPQTGIRSPGREAGRVAPWVLALIVVIVVGAGWWFWKSAGTPGSSGAATPAPGNSGAPQGQGGRKPAGANRPQTVSVAVARRQDVRVVVNAIGSFSASNTAIVRAQVSGVLQSIAFTEGQQVRAGQVLAQIDPRTYQASLGQAEGALARDKAQLENARLDVMRYRDLLAKDAISKQQLDTQEALVRQLEGTVKADQASVANARLQLSYTQVTAPIAGRVGLKQVDLGNVVQPADANGIVNITQTRPIALMFALPAAHLPQIAARLHNKTDILVEAWDRTGSSRLAAGQVATVDNAIDASTDTIKVKAVFANEDDALYPNQSVSVRLQLDVLKDALTVPQAAVLRGAQGFYVYVVAGDKTVSTRAVKPGAVDEGWMAVDGAIAAGEQIVIDGVDRLREGAQVEIASPEARPGAPDGRRRGAGNAAPYSGAPAAAGGATVNPTAATAGGNGGTNPAQGVKAQARDVKPNGLQSSEAGADARPRWMDRLPPEVAEKVSKMSPEERRAWFQKRQAETGHGGAPSN